MKRIIAFTLLLTLFISVTCNAIADKSTPFGGDIDWEDSLETVQEKMQTEGTVTKYNESITILTYNNGTGLFDDEATASLYFMDNKLYKINLDVNNPDITKYRI